MAGTATSDKIQLMRKCYPKLYDGHSFELAKRNSQVERTEKGLSEEMYAYGELDNEIFATIIEKITTAYGKGYFSIWGVEWDTAGLHSGPDRGLFIHQRGRNDNSIT